MRRRLCRLEASLLLSPLVLGGLTGSAAARGNGITADGCGGCHRDGDAEVTLTPDRTLMPGEEAIFTVRIAGPNVRSGGVFIPHPRSGTLRALSGEGLALVSLGLTHSRPKGASGDAVTFRFGWRPPDMPDGETLEVYAVAANANGNSGGDAPGGAVGDFVFGCEPQIFYRDADEDGHGWDTETVRRCAGSPPAGYAAVGGDCDDHRAEVHPGAVETCNERDDNCNGDIDEDSVPVELWPDADGDGYYAQREGEPLLGCVPTPGYAADSGDCDDDDPDVHLGAEEVCNYIDDNCDGRIDERVRPRCGVGFCERESYSCLPEDCYPGEPSEERCSGLDESCNGVVDEGELCDGGETCVSGECLLTTSLDPQVPAPGDGTPPSSETSTGGVGCTLSASGSPSGSPGPLFVLLSLVPLGWLRRSRG